VWIIQRRFPVNNKITSKNSISKYAKDELSENPLLAAGEGHKESMKELKKQKKRIRELSVPNPPETEHTPHSKRCFPVVGIGASAGGLEALVELFQNMPANTGMAFVVVTHQHPGHLSLLPSLLGKSTAMPVIEVPDGALLEPNHVYVSPPGGYVALMNSKLNLMQGPKEEIPPLPIDFFFRSLAQDQKECSICIILSGTGSDGTLGLKAVKGESGMAMVQEIQSAKYSGMPTSAIATSLADYILTPKDMPGRLIAYAKGLNLHGLIQETMEVPHDMEQPLQKIFLLLRSRTGHDFSSYKMNTLRRRIERRMNVHQIAHIDKYVHFLQQNPREIDILFHELLISVTSFFRDPEAFESLTNNYLPGLIDPLPENFTFRAWVPGCSTGEEAYTIAIILREYMKKMARTFNVQIFGTDLDSDAIETARMGLYPAGIAVDIRPERLEKYFVPEDHSFRIRKEIREMVIFAPQNVIKDPPFTKLELLSCRNLLIYFNSDLQKRLLPIFHYSLKPGGLLMLGPSETVGGLTDLFETLDKKWKIFKRKETTIPQLPDMPAELIKHANDKPKLTEPPLQKEQRLSQVIEKVLLNRFAPSSALVSENGDIVYIHGRTGAFLEPGTGQPHLNIIEMARLGLQASLASALREAAAQEKEAVREGIRVKTNGEYTTINLSVAKIHEPEMLKGLLLVTFLPVVHKEKVPEQNKKTKSANQAENVEDIARELQFTKESLRTTVGELETSNQELKSTNEELQSTNEELQSSNEELETSKEELQSLNEELSTVNTELEAKVEELSQSGNDMQNLLNSTDIATIFLDNDLNIRRFTEPVKKLIKIIPGDIGRPIGDLVSNLEHDNLEKSAREVSKTLVFKEEEVRTRSGLWYLMRIKPYRTTENVIEGIVITFVDINRIKKVEKTGLEVQTLLDGVFAALHEPLIVIDEKLQVVTASSGYYHVFHQNRKHTVGELLYDIGGGIWNTPKLRKVIERALKNESIPEEIEMEIDVPKAGRRNVTVRLNSLAMNNILPVRIMLLIEENSGKR
jgi:two-component system, chemotaxis family, CheB/CheR fusion protein